ncbi:hypothetical protein OO013_15270 [Mangrovivirga sp. M17]|uniref:Transmembrane family 220 protein n=1 Tax=Mangrovivirga halotolerans TaxID=2993936 RepID=A0ABT3RVH0_9BACT|nr:hypothetical protein [Mangrovivirga halotolerans]MCX2745237.1 hypothetical protein [Mangrovivirga halotolerans]
MIKYFLYFICLIFLILGGLVFLLPVSNWWSLCFFYPCIISVLVIKGQFKGLLIIGGIIITLVCAGFLLPDVIYWLSDGGISLEIQENDVLIGRAKLFFGLLASFVLQLVLFYELKKYRDLEKHG